MTARQHHYVSQCYLKGFATRRRKPKLFVIDAKNRTSFTTSPSNVGVERDFHRIDADGLQPDALENALAGFESELAPALERIISARSIKNDDDRALLLNLIGLLHIKNPAMRESIRQFHEQISKVMMSMAVATPERWASQVRQMKRDGYLPEDADTDYEKMRDFIERDQYKINLYTGRHLQLELETFDKILPYIFGRKWMLLKAPKGTTGFITSDHPVCLMWSDPKMRAGNHPVGLGLRRTQILFPISNELALMGAFEAENMEGDVPEHMVAQINGSILLHAKRQIYARESDFVYQLKHHRRMMRGNELLKDERTLPSRTRSKN